MTIVAAARPMNPSGSGWPMGRTLTRTIVSCTRSRSSRATRSTWPSRRSTLMPSPAPGVGVLGSPVNRCCPTPAAPRSDEGAPTRTVADVILPRERDRRFITIRRGGTLTDTDHRLLALWAAACAEHVLHLFESLQPADPRPRHAIEHIRAWTRGDVTMSASRAAGGHAMGAARDLRGAARHAAYAAGQAAVVAHVAAHEL